jgi:hypothetical protein
MVIAAPGCSRGSSASCSSSYERDHTVDVHSDQSLTARRSRMTSIERTPPSASGDTGAGDIGPLCRRERLRCDLGRGDLRPHHPRVRAVAPHLLIEPLDTISTPLSPARSRIPIGRRSVPSALTLHISPLLGDGPASTLNTNRAPSAVQARSSTICHPSRPARIIRGPLPSASTTHTLHVESSTRP